ncbi:hypothetical protein [Fusobacterium polymorphum]|jgi:hypothetical protein|uniref:Uncharacterized protein n=1 Tax=Fusobacterium nucleatum subsp. polymorphum TaxID=76857 RepID=A0A2C6BWP2_FUSNP|nr:hypothetical protein [Fusobacterium polymorphum]PHI08282.1 hypothetical protein CBG52_08905 [Fusobacterium polymorphum]
MENYILEISKYYFKGVLNNEVIQKVLSKKEEKFHIQEKVVRELDELKEFILEMSKLDFPLDSIKESVDSFIKDSEYLQKVPNLNIDLESILVNDTGVNSKDCKNDIIEEKALTLIESSGNTQTNEIIENKRTTIIDNDKIEIIPGVIIDKSFEKNSFFEKICDLYLETSTNIGNLVFQETTFDSITSGEFETKMNRHIRALENKLIAIIPRSVPSDLFDGSFAQFLAYISVITEVGREERRDISSDVSDLHTLQKLSRSGGSSLFVGNLYAMGAFAAFKGIKSIYDSVSDSNERDRFRNTRETNFMNQFYKIMEENLENELFNTLPMTYNIMALNFGTIFPNILFREFNDLMNAKLKFEDEYKKLPTKITKSNYNQVVRLLSLYPYPKKIWTDFFSVISIDEFFILEKNLEDNKYSNTLRRLSKIRNSKILTDSNNLELIYATITKITNDSVLNIFNERFNKKIEKKKLEFFIKILKYIFDNYDISKDFSEKDLLIANLLKENLNKNLEVYFENKKIDIFMYINDISNILDKNIFLMNFMSANDVIKLINEKYNIYKENTSINEKQILTNIQNSINKDLELIKNTKLSERNFMKFFILFNYFKQNSIIKKLLNNTRNLKDEIIHLTWNTEYSTGLITLSSLFFKIKKEEYMLFIHDIEKVKINNLSIEIETKSWKYTIPIFNSSEFSTEKEEAVKGLALYIKKLSKYWNDISKDLIIFINNNFKEIDNLYSKPNFSLEFIFDLGLRAENIFKVFLKSGFVTERDITLRINKLNSIANRLNKYQKQTDKIAVYPFDKELIKDIQKASQDEFDKYISSEILAVYIEKVIENDYEDPNDESIIVLTEKSLVIFTNSFGEVPLNIIENISIKGFATHTLVLKTTKGEFTCFMKTADDSNKIFIDLVKEYMSLIN